jgi:hypothetical protein
VEVDFSDCTFYPTYTLFVPDQTFTRGIESSEGQCTGSVANIVGAFKVKQIGDAAGHAIGQFTRHRVFSGQRHCRRDALLHLLFDRALHLDRQAAEGRCLRQGTGILGKIDA